MPIGKTYETLRADIEQIPVIDTHEHFRGPPDQPDWQEPISSLITGYVRSDILSAGASQADLARLDDRKIGTEDKWPLFAETWEKVKHTAYARVTNQILANEYGVEEITLESVKSLSGRLINLRDEQAYEAMLDKYNIRCCLSNVWMDWKKFLAGEIGMHPRNKLLIGGPELHGVRNFGSVENVAGRISRRVTSLDEYIDVLRDFCTQMKAAGAIGLKDQSAYGREISYDSHARAEAEQQFGYIMDDPRRSLGWPAGKALDDYIFHCLMRICRELELPVQIHTGHMAGVRNDVVKTNAAHFRNVLELHQEVRFDLFHANWPYAGDLLYLGKNYPNVALDLCWANIIDSRYCRRLLADSLVTVPHTKVHAFGGDYGALEFSCGHLVIARDNVAAALAEMVDDQWMDLDDARQVAADWLFNNPNRFFNLGYEPVTT